MDDSGLAGERTALAWMRTALSALAAAAILARLTIHDLGPGAFVALGIAVVLTACIFVDIRHSGSPSRRGPERRAMALCLVVATMIVTEFAALVAGSP